MIEETTTVPHSLPDEIARSLARAGFIDEADPLHAEPLDGGVSSDIWKVETAGRTFCVKRALPHLRVSADWHAPVERNLNEVAWCRIANRIVPGIAPEILFNDPEVMLYVMTYLGPAAYRLWKSELRDGRADTGLAAEVARRLVRTHSVTAGDRSVADEMPDAGHFADLRLEPYLQATTAHHPDLAAILMELCGRTAALKIAMIHGDVSPKNIMIGPDGPVFLDAECACMGDPAFDIAFCLNHLMLKCVWRPESAPDFHAAFEAMASAYLDGVDWEGRDELEARAATLLPGLFLARVDGKSPVEYITEERERDSVRRTARDLLSATPRSFAEVLDRWKKELAG